MGHEIHIAFNGESAFALRVPDDDPPGSVFGPLVDAFAILKACHLEAFPHFTDGRCVIQLIKSDPAVAMLLGHYVASRFPNPRRVNVIGWVDRKTGAKVIE